ncbi:organic cation transporter protein-like [Melitaea cinxia]|uniref:organic cation transporter protein-like n=1 Tax=Melitaea cinxia TaxID=113334 RepID=UPI001E270B06|nr:organic cation transporter protein-like [Melitaea cinxia]
MSVQSNIANEREGQFNLDGILSELGSFGKYQLLLLFLLAFRDSFLSMCNYNYVFTAAEVPYRCRIPECESTPGYAAHFATNASCRRPALNETACEARETNATVECEDVVYEDYNSIVAEFDLGCQPWKRTLIGTVHNLGLVFSFVISGLISDRYGRKVIIVGTPLMVGAAGVLKSFAFNYWMLIVLEFLETALGYGNASMVLSLELVSQENRVAFSCISDILASLGGAFFGLIAWKIPYWRHMMRAIYAPLLIVLFYIFLVDEGVRWLLAHNRKDEAVRVLNKVAKINNITLSNKAKEMLTSITEERSKVEKVQPETERPQIFSVLRSKAIVVRMAIMAACFFSCIFVHSGAIIYTTSISGSKYLNYSIMMLVDVPTRIVTAFTLTRFGRKTPICVAYCLCALFFMTSAFVHKSVWWVSVIFYMAGKMCSSYGNFSVYVVAMELFPTTSRNSLTNIANTFGRLGSVLAPQAPLLEKYMSGLPSLTFALAALGTALLTLCLPDTSRTALPDRVSDAERIDAPGDNNDASNA